MDTRRKTSGGLTLVEMLTVMAIIALLAGIVIPGFMRSGAFAKDEVSGAARTLYSELVAARNYAAMHRVDTAVVYVVGTRQDSFSGAWTPVLAGTATARRMTRQEYDAYMAVGTALTLYKGCESEDDYPFVLLQNHHGQFGMLGEYACVLHDPLHHTTDPVGSTGPTEPFERGLVPVRVYQMLDDGTGIEYPELVTPPPPDSEYSADTAKLSFLGYPDPNQTEVERWANFRFPAHVFQSNGMMRTDPVQWPRPDLYVPDLEVTARQRFVIDLGPTPDALVEDRYVEEPEGVNPGTLRRPKQIELYKTTGRVKINS